MSLLSKLGLIKETEVEEQTTETKPSEKKQEVKQIDVSETRKSTISFAPPTSSMMSGKIVGKIDNGIFDKLSIAIEENNLKGNDFLEFMQSLNKMSSLAVDEKMKFNMVFATLSTSDGGMTKEHLVESIDHYIGVIDNEKTIFKTEMSKVSSEMVDQKEIYAEQLSKTAQEKAEQIQKLNQEIQEISETITSVKTEAAQSKVAIEQKQADFDVTVQQLEGQILDYKSKITQYIQ